MGTQTLRVEKRRAAERPRDFVAARGPDAADYLQRMLSNDVETLAVGETCDALLLTAKARVIAALRVLRRGKDDFLLLTEPGLGEAVLTTLARTRFAAKVAIAAEEHRNTIVFGEAEGLPTHDYGDPAVEVLDAVVEGEPLSAEELELLRIEAGTPAWGREIDDRILPAEAGLDGTHVSFTKGCYPGQEPIARLRYRGHANRQLRRLALGGPELPAADLELRHDGKAVGRVTSAARRADGSIAALGFIRTEVALDAVLDSDLGPVRQRG